MEFKHYSVLANECMELLDIKPDGIYVDCTLGGAGHTRLILSRLGENGRVIGIDRDNDALANAKEKINDSRFTPFKSNYEDVATVLDELGIEKADGFLFDLGVSSYQLDTPERGFSYINDAPLDMRMDTSGGITAYDVVNTYSESELARIIFEYGEDKFARRIASRIVRERSEAPIATTGALADIISAAVPGQPKGGHPAKRAFQAIRIEVNGELSSVGKALESAAGRLKKGGRIAVISFHCLGKHLCYPCFSLHLPQGFSYLRM